MGIGISMFLCLFFIGKILYRIEMNIIEGS